MARKPKTTAVAKPPMATPGLNNRGKPYRNAGGPKGGAPKGSANRIRHGLRCSMLPKDCKYIEYRLNKFRRTLEAQVLALRGDLTVNDAANIQTALRWERHSELAARWLRIKQKELKPEQLMLFSREIAKASAERDKSLANLRLGKEGTPLPWLTVEAKS